MPVLQACACRFVLQDGWLRLQPETECGYHRALRSAPPAVEKDAARYRYLRQAYPGDVETLFWSYSAEELDAAIDAADRSHEPQQEPRK